MAVLGLVFAFVMPVLGAVFSAIGLRQTKQRGEGGRGLAVAGLVVSVVVIVVAVALVAVLGAGLTMAADRAQPLSGPGAAAPGAAGGVPAGGGQGVVDACHVILPAMTQVEAEVGADHGTDPVDTRITALQQQITAAAAPSGDPVFIQHAQALAADFGRLVSVARTGGDFGTLLTDIEQDGAAIGRDCGSAGWTP
jgi:peptidyl-prolyl cis-trans isomerase B (cyclophilin B)